MQETNSISSSPSAPNTEIATNTSQDTLHAIIHHPVIWLFTLLWVLAGIGNFVLDTSNSAIIHILTVVTVVFPLLIALLSFLLTRGAPVAPWQAPATYTRGRMRLHLSLVLSIIVVVGLFEYILTKFSSASWAFPVFIGISLIGVLAPAIVLRLMGIRWREMGFTRGYHSWRVIAFAAFLPITMTIITLALKRLDSTQLLQGVVISLLLAAIPEELVYRGITYTRMTRLFSIPTSLVLSALVFGLVHIPTRLSMPGGLLLLLCSIVFNQCATGFALAIVYQRTRSLWPAIVLHACVDLSQLVLGAFFMLK